MERISIGSFSTEHFGLRGRMRSTFSKRVRNFGTRLVRKWSEKDENWSELDLRPPFWAFLNAKLIAGGPGTSWNHSGPLKQFLKIGVRGSPEQHMFKEKMLRPMFQAFVMAKMIAGGPGTSWNHSRDPKTNKKIQKP